MKFQEAIVQMRAGEKVALPHWAFGISIHLPHGALAKWSTRQGHPYILNIEEAMSEDWFVAPAEKPKA